MPAYGRTPPFLQRRSTPVIAIVRIHALAICCFRWNLCPGPGRDRGDGRGGAEPDPTTTVILILSKEILDGPRRPAGSTHTRGGSARVPAGTASGQFVRPAPPGSRSLPWWTRAGAARIGLSFCAVPGCGPSADPCRSVPWDSPFGSLLPDDGTGPNRSSTAAAATAAAGSSW